MTYREMIAQLSNIRPDKLDMEVHIYDAKTDEIFAVDQLHFALDNQDNLVRKLARGQPYLRIR